MKKSAHPHSGDFPPAPRDAGTRGLGLFDALEVVSAPTATSENAGDALLAPEGKKRRETQALRVLRCIAEREAGRTNDEIAAETGILTQSVCLRIRDLRATLLIDTSDTITRNTRSGRGAAVHFITQKGRAVLRQQEAA